jgi:hypoxanthine-guanine phosphoribosyltransferase
MENNRIWKYIVNLQNDKLVKREDEYLIIVDDMLDSGKTIDYIDYLINGINNLSSSIDDIIYLFLFSNNNAELIFNTRYIKHYVLIKSKDKYNPDKWYFGCGLDLNQKLRDIKNIYSTNKQHFLSLSK